MFKTRNLIAAVVASIALGGAASAAWADDVPAGEPGHPHPMMHHGMGMMFKGLHLTDAQKAQIKQMMQANRPAMQQQMQAMRATHQQEQALLFSSDYSDAKVDQLAQANAGQMATAHAAHLKQMHQMYAVLTPEQQQKLQANIKAAEARRAQEWAAHAKMPAVQ